MLIYENNRPIAGMFTWTALDRKQKLKVLKGLPDHLHKVLPENDAARRTIFTG